MLLLTAATAILAIAAPAPDATLEKKLPNVTESQVVVEETTCDDAECSEIVLSDDVEDASEQE